MVYKDGLAPRAPHGAINISKRFAFARFMHKLLFYAHKTHGGSKSCLFNLHSCGSISVSGSRFQFAFHSERSGVERRF